MTKPLPRSTAYCDITGHLDRKTLELAVDDSPGRVSWPVWSTGTGGLLVGCGSGLVVIHDVQWEGGPKQDALALLEAGQLPAGTHLGAT